MLVELKTILRKGLSFMVTFSAKVYDGDRLIADTIGDTIVFYDTTPDVKIRKFLIRGTKNMGFGDFVGWLEDSRCVPRERIDLKRVLAELGLKTYNPLRIVEKTHGIMYPVDNIRVDITDVVESWRK